MLALIARQSKAKFRWIAGANTGSAAVAQTLAGRFIVLGVNLLNGILTARHLGAAGRGEQAAMTQWPQLICFILTFGLPYGLLYHARKHERERDSLSSVAIVLSLLLGVLATGVGIAVIPLWLHQYDRPTVVYAQELMLFAPIVMLSLTGASLFELRFDFTSSNLLRYAPPVLTLLTLLALLATHRFTPFATALAYMAPAAVSSSLIGLRLIGTFRFTLSDFARSCRRLFGYGFRIYGSNILGTFGQQVDQLLVVSMLSASNLGVYAVALNTSRVLNVFQTSLSIVLLPKTIGQETAAVVRLVGRLARLTTLITAASGVLLVLLLPLLLPSLYGSDFGAAVIISQVLIVEATLGSTTGVLAQTFIATDKPGVYTLLQGAGLAIAVPLMLLWIPRFGVLGAALALLCSTAARLVLALVCYPLLLKQPPPSLIVKSGDFRYLFEAVARRAAKT